MGMITFVTSFGISGLLFNEFNFIQEATLGITLTGVYYFIDPR